MVFRRGQWVVRDGKVGIHLGPRRNDPHGVVEVHLVDEDGITVEEVWVDAQELRSAKLGEIPEARKATSDQGMLAARYEA